MLVAAVGLQELAVAPVLEPYLNRAFRHVDLLGYLLPHDCCGRRVLAEFPLECDQLVLRSSLSLLVLLLLRQSALTRWSS